MFSVTEMFACRISSLRERQDSFPKETTILSLRLRSVQSNCSPSNGIHTLSNSVRLCSLYIPVLFE